MRNSDALPTQSAPGPEDAGAGRHRETPTEPVVPQESDRSTTPPHGDPLLDASEHADDRDADESTAPPSSPK